MTEVLRSSPSSSPSSSLSCAPSTAPNHHDALFLTHSYIDEVDSHSRVTGHHHEINARDEQRDQLSLLALLVTLLRKSFGVACRTGREELCSMEIGSPTNVRHVAHVTFDRFNGFLGLPVEFEPEVPRRVPSASATVFGVSTKSMQLSYDHRGNCVPTILLLMQRRLYGQGGLQAEGIFRINAENSQEEYVRDQLNSGIVPEGVDVHCLAGLIKAWFRELPSGVLDFLSPEDVNHCQSEEECAALVNTLPQTEAALLDWAVNLMADVVQQEHINKMNAHNIAMVFAPNMTQMADPYTALMYAVQVMNFLKTLILKVVREREECLVESAPVCCQREPSSDGSGHNSPLQYYHHVAADSDDDMMMKPAVVNHVGSSSGCDELDDYQSCVGKAAPPSSSSYHSMPAADDDDDYFEDCEALTDISESEARIGNSLLSVADIIIRNAAAAAAAENGMRHALPPRQRPTEKKKSKEMSSNLSRINSATERIEAWR